MPSTKFKNRTTPGVYITELDAFPPSIVGVATAVPAFIGYTEKAEVNGKQSFNKAIRVGSLADFEQYFGKQFQPQYDIENGGPDDNTYDFRVASNRIFSPSGLASPAIDGYEYYYLKQDTASKFNLYDSMRLFYANGGGNCFVVSVGNYQKSAGAITLSDLRGGLDVIRNQAGPTMLVIPDAVLITDPPTPGAPAPPSSTPPYFEQFTTSSGFQTLVQNMLQQCADLQDRIAILDVYSALSVVDGNTLDTAIERFKVDVDGKNLNYGMAYFPFLLTSVVQATDFNFTNFTATSLTVLQKILELENDNLYPPPPHTSPHTSPPLASKNGAVWALIDSMTGLHQPPTDPTKLATWPTDVKTLDQNLSVVIPLYAQIMQIMVEMNSVLPPSAAMAGVYTYTDGTRGVWNAPANLDLAGVVSTTFKLNDEQQGDLNVPVDGKAVNAIREFVGRGPVVWGARTLDGNSNDWRYVQVRRTLIYVEQSVKLALNQFVFAANDGNTWTTVVAMVSNFLTNLWSQGGLMGDKATDAFTVQCGLGSTMTGMDILQGYMVVQVTLQMIHPAEFIELTFKQQMQGVSS